ncbi:cubilin [Periplaneta americana]|uniref:cubilin n=1 Tax=Periplaneta americana TaxID=6978 RepID=UPI0037E72574
MWATTSAVLLTALLPFIYEARGQVVFNTQPRIVTQDGHLLLFSGLDRNITLRTSGRGSVNLNNDNLAQLVKTAKSASETIQQLRTSVLIELEQNVNDLQNTVQGPQGLQNRLATVERNVRNNSAPGVDGALGKRVTAINRRLVLLERQVRQLRTLLTTNECSSNPCHNGGTCIDTYNGFFCRCPENWEGILCNVDVNECAHFAGTDIGCQNGATCINKPGTYECMCSSDWFGVHCTQRSDDCMSAPSDELCGHGTCVSVKSTGSRGYKCICDQGWTTHGGVGPCIWDVDECSSNTRPACSVNPPVQCINVPGSFYCGACPQGYTGNGFYCSDIDECQNNNGGCSTSPLVQCINTQGSRICGQCPPGYQGDGRICNFLGTCAVNNGGCHPLARCLDNPRISQSYVECICPSGYVGSGFGSAGCVPSSSGSGSSSGGGQVDPCSRIHCVYGHCMATFNGTAVCLCQPGYIGPLCNVPVDPCISQPCQNSGTCVRVPGSSSYTCTCRAGFRGTNCQEEEQSCGGVFTDLSGTITFPRSGSVEYGHNINCAWVIITNTTKVLQLNFTKFDLERSPNCQLDFLQVHDGRSAGAHMIGRFCNTIPNITSTHNKIYLWFRTDHSVARGGISFNWNSTDPVCGSQNPIYFTTHGLLASPGSPGRYPNNRDCYWTLIAPNSRRIQLHFFTMQIEASANCSNDYLEVLSGWQQHQVAIYCNTSHPRPLTLPGNQATLHFHTNEAVNDAGFQISYTSIEGFPGCGGVLTAPSGEIQSPNHPDRYRENLDCEWHIQLPVGERIRLTFLTFSLEDSPRCLYDFVALKTGIGEDAEIVGRYCGSRMPVPYTSIGNELVVHFSTDWSYNAEGFRIKYEAICGGRFSGTNGVIKSPYYPNVYPANRICLYEIELPPGQAVRLCFQDFSVEDSYYDDCRFDYVEIRDGHENATLLGHFCGSHAPCVTSQLNFMWLKFVTDGSVSNRGFYANYSAIDVGCGGIFRERQGSIQSPNYPLLYPTSRSCLWVILGGPGTVVQLTWYTFQLERGNYRGKCFFDKVSVFDNSSTPEHGGLMGEYCGTTLPPILTTTGNVMTIAFSTDVSGSYEGFSARYVILDASTMCGANYFSQKGALQSPNYPNVYPNNKDCKWVISVPTGQQIKLNVTDFLLESGNRCYYDFLEIRNGGTELAPLIGKFCGTTIPRSIPSLSNQIYLRFKTDSSGMYRGFRITWDGTTTGCGGTLTASSGSIISPNYPQPYGHNGECFWRISISKGSVIQLVFVDLELENHSRCMHDYVEIYDGRDTKSRKIGRYCTTDPVVILLSSSNYMFIKFRSDVSIATRGFHLRYQTVCNNVVKGYSGVIESPNFPSNYADNTDCTWNITAPRGNKINITFSHFELEDNSWLWSGQRQCRHDYVEMKEGEDNAAPDTMLMDRKCGSEIPRRIHSSKNHVYVHFVTDSSQTHPGFRLEWVVHGCGGILNKPSAVFTSPNYPRFYPTNTVCEWIITVSWGRSIELTITNFSMENTPNCRFDSLTVYAGTDDSGPQITQFCHTDSQKVVTSSSNNMFVRFMTDFSYQGRGFRAVYRTVESRCGGKFTMPFGSIHSPNYPKNYDNNLDCRWLIEVDPNYVIFFKFEDFDVFAPSCRQTGVQVFDGNSTNSTELFNRCSPLSAEDYSNFTSTSNQLLVVMRTGNYRTAKGFRASYNIACGARIVAEDTGVISINSAINTDYSHNCSWTIIAANLENRVTLTITTIDVSPGWSSSEEDCPYYHIEVRDGDNAEAPLIGSYCGSRAPPHLTSQGSAMFVQAVSEYGGHYGAFTATYSVLSTACGGNLSSEHGSFASPGYPNNYPLESSCVWYIGTSPGNRVLISFSLFELESSDFCNEDYVEVRRESAIGPIIGVYCGTDLPTNITAAHSIWVKFQSSGTGTARGFIADYSMLHGNNLNGPSGQIASPLYPNFYLHSGQFFWRIVVDSGKAIAITFKEFFIDIYSLTECHYYLAIYDGFDETAVKLFQGCGGNLPDPVTSSSNIVYIEFNSSPVRLGSKFFLEWLQVVRQVTPRNPEVPAIPGCGGMISLEVSGNRSTESYVLTSPGYPEGYANMLNCEWIFETSPLNHLRMYFTDMNIEESETCFLDYVEVYVGRRGQPDWNLISTFCHPNATYEIIRSTNLLKVVFHTDYYSNRTGFRAIVDIECGGFLSGPNGVIDMRNETRARNWNSLFSSLMCEWNVTVQTGKTIAVEFETFNIPSVDTDHCQESYIVLRNGRTRASPMLGQGRFCGTSRPTNIPETTGNKLGITFKGATFDASFKLLYREVSVACGGRVQLTPEDNSTIISSPNYPNAPPPHTECEWIVMAPAGERLHIEFLERFDVTVSFDCRQAFVELREGATVNSELINRFCRDMPGSQYTVGNILYVRFFTDVTDPRNGFKANVSIATCGGTLRGQTGHLTLPTYPGSYPNNLDCTWRLVGLPDHFLTMWFDDLNMPYLWNCSSGDYVVVSESLPDNSTAVSELARYCRRQIRLPPPFNSTSNEVTVKFHSDDRSTSRGDFSGFSLRYNTSQEACGGRLEGPSGVFQSPGYPSTQGYRRYCKWDIIVPEGRRIKIEMLDFDLETSMEAIRHRILFLDGIRNSVPAKWLYATNTPEIVRSTGNTMRVMFVSYHNAGHRGFKARYTSDEPSLCLGDLNGDSGYIRPPSKSLNLTYFHCEWERNVQADSNRTIAFTMLNGTFGNQKRQICYYQANMAAITTKSNKNTYLGDFCGNYTTPETVLSPYMDVVVLASQGKYNRAVEFVLQYKVFNCGGILSGPQDVVSSPVAANGKYPPSTYCAWTASYPSGSVINITFTSLKLQSDCSADYVLIRNGPYPNSPLLNKYCGATVPAPMLSEANSLWIEFHSDASDEDQGFTLRLEPVFEGCGGILQTSGSTFTTPKFPANYPPNSECTWDIKFQEGYFISLSFIERFDIEQSTDCTQDFVQIFNYIGNAWVLMNTLCGRNQPPTINSTGSQMRVLFRSNSGGANSGFKARFDVGCGGVISNSKSGHIMSPGFPTHYGFNLYCNYTILAPGRSVMVEFEVFELEESWDCYFDWLKVYQKNRWVNSLDLLGKYCGTNAPPPLWIKDMVLLSFKTDSSVNQKGFLLKYQEDSCGGNVTQPGIIQSPHFNGLYLEGSNCTWNITAPVGHVILLRFSTFVVEYSLSCHYDFVRVFDSDTMNNSLLLGQLCGNISNPPPILYSTGNKMLVQFVSDYSQHYPGFTAAVIFQTACGGTIQVNRSSAILQPIATSDQIVSCQWMILGARDQQVQLTITSLNIRPCSNASANTTSATNCSCSYVEVRDGPGPLSDLIQRFCGTTIPSPITSSANQMWVMFISENGVTANSFRATATGVQSVCGQMIRNVTSSYQELTSPGYPSNYPANTRCSWYLMSNEYRRFDLHFVDLDLEPSTGCTADYLSVETLYIPYSHNLVTEGLGQNLIYNGGNRIMYQSFYSGTRYPLTKSTFCGRGLPLDFYSDRNAVQMIFSSNGAVTSKGFKIRYAFAGCNRNYTGVQGRIWMEEVSADCTLTVQAPTNSTIALYFLSFYRDTSDECSSAGLEVRDGPSRNSPKLARLCGYMLPNPIFSTGNTLWIHAYGGSTYNKLDITYTTTDQGRGCGGRLFNYGGVFTSPMYPNNYRNASQCRWDVSVPVETQPLLKFTVFDIGSRSTCTSDFLEIYDVDLENNVETFVSRYCGEDNPVIHEGSTGTISVRYVTSMHNGGTGWVAHFIARKPGELVHDF